MRLYEVWKGAVTVLDIWHTRMMYAVSVLLHLYNSLRVILQEISSCDSTYFEALMSM